MLRVPVTKLTHTRYPAVDVHTHFAFKLEKSGYGLDQFVEVMRLSAADSNVPRQDEPAKESSQGIAFENPVNPELLDVTT